MLPVLQKGKSLITLEFVVSISRFLGFGRLVVFCTLSENLYIVRKFELKMNLDNFCALYNYQIWFGDRNCMEGAPGSRCHD